jgi:Phosphodiester glycosidase
MNAILLLMMLLHASPLSPSPSPSPAPSPSTPTGAELGYERVTTLSGVEVHLFRFSLADFELRLLEPGEGRSSATVAAMTEQGAALLGVNGSFFLADFRPLGLLVSEGRERQGLRKVDWGVFFVKQGRAAMIHTRDFKGSEGMDFAIQSGPRLVVDGELIKVKPQRARRSMIGVDAEGRVLIAVSATSLLLPEAAAFMRRVGARFALNLDGGPSSQLSYPARGVHVTGFGRVANGIGVFARAKPITQPSTR